MKTFTENDSIDVPNPEDALFWQLISVLLYEDNHGHSKHNKEHPHKDEIERLREIDHISFVNADAGHPTLWTETSKKLFDPKGEVAEDEGVEESKGDKQQLSLPHPLHLVHLLCGVSQQANSSSDSLFGESSEDEGIDGEDGLTNQEEWDGDQPEEHSRKNAETLEPGSDIFWGQNPEEKTQNPEKFPEG